MAYLGNDLQVAYQSYQIIDDISGSFNGVLTTFPLQVGGVTPVPFPINPQQCLISVNGVIQEPDPSGTSGFNLVGSNIEFSSAPTGGHAFFGVILAGADYVNVGVNYPSGSESAPSITFDTDLDTGVYNPAVNELGLVTNGNDAIRINSSGDVTLSADLTVDSGRLLVGTSSSLDLNAPIQVAGTTYGIESFRFSTSATGSGGAIDLARSNSGTIGTTSAIVSGQGLGIIRFRGAGDGSTYLTGAEIEATSDGGTVSASSMPTRLMFSTTADGDPSPTERMRIDSTGATTLTRPNSTSSSPHLLLVDTGDNRTASIWNNIGSLKLQGSGTSSSTGIDINHGNSYIEYTGAQYFSGVGTTASAANAFLNSGSSPANQLLRSTSSLRYKTDIEDLEEERSACIFNFRPVWYRSTADADRKDWSWYGLIAEEVAKIEPRLVHWTYLEDSYEEVDGEKQLKPDAEMVPDGVQYDRLTVLLLDVVKRQQQTIEALEAAVTALQQS